MTRKHLTLEEVIKAHTAYSRILSGMQEAQSGFEDLHMSNFFEGHEAEMAKIRAAIMQLSTQAKDFAKGKGALLELVKNVDKVVNVFQPNQPTDESWRS